MDIKLQNLILPIASKIEKIGFHKIPNKNEFVAQFRRETWIIEISIERYYTSGYMVNVIKIEGETYRSFAVWILMDIHTKIFSTPQKSYSLESQINFIEEQNDFVFDDHLSYFNEYVSLNRGEPTTGNSVNL